MPIGAIVSGVASLAGPVMGGLLGAGGASAAAKAQAEAAEKARKLYEQNQNAAIDFTKGIWSNTQQDLQPYTDLGGQSAGQLSSFLDTPFKAPTIEDVRNTPGYQFQLEQGIGALDKSAAARGNLFSGTQGTELEKFAGGLADTTYGEAYNRAMQEYMNRYGILRDVTGMGLQAAGTEGQLGLGTSGQVGNAYQWGAQGQANALMNIGQARASGYINKANAWQGALPGIMQAVVGITQGSGSGGDE